MKDREWFIEQCIGAFPDGAWYYQLDYHPDKVCDEKKVKKQILYFENAVYDYLDEPLRRCRPRVLTRTKKWSRGGQIYYTHYMLCSRRREISRRDIAQAWQQWTGGSATSESIQTRAEAERRAVSIAHYYLEGGTEDE